MPGGPTVMLARRPASPAAKVEGQRPGALTGFSQAKATSGQVRPRQPQVEATPGRGSPSGSSAGYDRPSPQRWRALGARVPKACGSPVGAHHPVAVAIGARHQGDHGLRGKPEARAVVGRLAEREHAAVPAGQPVAVTARGCGDADYGGDQVELARRAVEAGVAVAEDAPVGRDEPVALAVRRRGHAHDRLGKVEACRRAVEAGVAVGVHSSPGCGEPITFAAWRRGHGDDFGSAKLLRARRTEVGGTARGKYPPRTGY